MNDKFWIHLTLYTPSLMLFKISLHPFLKTTHGGELQRYLFIGIKAPAETGAFLFF